MSTRQAWHACMRVCTRWLGRAWNVTQQTVHVCMRAHACVGEGAGWPGGRGGREGPARGMRAACGPGASGRASWARHWPPPRPPDDHPEPLGMSAGPNWWRRLPGWDPLQRRRWRGAIDLGRPARKIERSRADPGERARATRCRSRSPTRSRDPSLSGGPREAPTEAEGPWAGAVGPAAHVPPAGPRVGGAAAAAGPLAFAPAAAAGRLAAALLLDLWAPLLATSACMGPV
jgi:hypothetical protein